MSFSQTVSRLYSIAWRVTMSIQSILCFGPATRLATRQRRALQAMERDSAGGMITGGVASNVSRS